jgi:hypothetical protein
MSLLQAPGKPERFRVIWRFIGVFIECVALMTWLSVGSVPCVRMIGHRDGIAVMQDNMSHERPRRLEIWSKNVSIHQRKDL